MAQPNSALSSLEAVGLEPVPDDVSWRDITRLLERAARLSAEHGVDSDRFMEAAWTACLAARPGLREELEDKELRAQLKKLRKRGLVAAA